MNNMQEISDEIYKSLIWQFNALRKYQSGRVFNIKLLYIALSLVNSRFNIDFMSILNTVFSTINKFAAQFPIAHCIGDNLMELGHRRLLFAHCIAFVYHRGERKQVLYRWDSFLCVLKLKCSFIDAIVSLLWYRKVSFIYIYI